jgi:AcrR family transcriptional regulator
MASRSSPAVNTAQQERSRRTELAIASALSTLLREKQFADISVADIAERAGVSVGGFYARFPSKDSLLALVELEILEEFNATAATALDPARFASSGLAAITLAYAQLLVANFRARGPEIVQILRYTRKGSDTERRLREFNIGVHDRMRALLNTHIDEICGPDPARTINLGLFFAAATAREAVLTRNLQVYPVSVTDQELADEIGHALYLYLTVELPSVREGV